MTAPASCEAHARGAGLARPAVLLALAAAGALAQAVIAGAWRGPGQAAFFGTLLVGWAGALVLAAAGRHRRALGARPAALASGGALFAAGLALMLTGGGSLHTAHRFAPLLAGLGLAVAASGWRRLGQWRSELALLAMTLLHPFPHVLRPLLTSLPKTAWLAECYLRVVGFPVSRAGIILSVPGSTVEVGEGCDGIWLTSQLLVLVVILACLFRTTALEKVLLAASALGLGFAANAGRVATLAFVASRAPDAYELLDGEGRYAPVFTVATVLVALLAWWALLRATRALRERAARGADRA